VELKHRSHTGAIDEMTPRGVQSVSITS
jgi:hypothetical protein